MQQQVTRDGLRSWPVPAADRGTDRSSGRRPRPGQRLLLAVRRVVITAGVIFAVGGAPARGQSPPPAPNAPPPAGVPAAPTNAPPAAPPTRPLPPSAAPAPAPTVLLLTPPKADEAVTDKWWFWTAIGGAIVLTATVLIIATRPEKAPSTKLGNMEAFRR